MIKKTIFSLVEKKDAASDILSLQLTPKRIKAAKRQKTFFSLLKKIYRPSKSDYQNLGPNIPVVRTNSQKIFVGKFNCRRGI